jgi:cytochrome d ubiquinol oxidase subunit I
MILAGFEAVVFAVAGLQALLWLRHRLRAHEAAMRIAFLFAAAAALLQPLTGDLSAKSVAVRQPAKLAAMEALQETQAHAPLKLGPVKIPGLLSFLAYRKSDAIVMGLKDFPEGARPPSFPTHLAFEIMVLVGFFLAGVALCGLLLFRRKQWPEWFAKILVLCTPLGFLSLEAGWVVTEVGRQPWILYGLILTRDAVTPRQWISISFVVYVLLYLVLAGIVAILLKRQTHAFHAEVRKKRRTA